MMKVLIIIFAIFALCSATMRDEIIQQAEQLKVVRDQLNQARTAFSEYHNEAIKSHQHVQELIRKKNTDRNAPINRATQQCLTAVTQLTATFTNVTCGTYITLFFQIGQTSDVRLTATNNFCNNCQGLFVSAVQNVVSQCNLTDFAYETARAVGFYPKFLCSKDTSGKFCANALAEAAALVPAQITNITQSQLDTICNTCVLTALNILVQGKAVSVNYYNAVVSLGGICVKYGGKYCILNLKDSLNNVITVGQKFSTGAEVSSGDFKSILDTFCTPCFRILIARLSLGVSIPEISILKNFDGIAPLCRKNPNKEYCIVKIYSLAKQYLTNPSSLPCKEADFTANSNGTFTCSTDCSNVFKKVINDGGCCWAVLVDTISGSGPGSDSDAKNNIYNAIKTCAPGITIPDPCPSTASATITITYTNLNIDWVNANKAIFIQAVLGDLSITIGGYDSINNNSITVSTTTNKKRATTTTVAISAVNVPATAGGALSVSTSNCINVCSTVPANDPSASVSVSSSTSNLSIQSSSNLITYSFALLFILSLFFF